MSFVTYPLNNTEYSAEDVESYHATRSSGVYANNSFGIAVSGTSDSVTIGPGIGWIKNGEFSGKGIAQRNFESVSLDVADPVYPRIDAIVIQFDANSNETNVVSKSGVASSSPIPPSVTRTESLYELHLYHIFRKAGSSEISDADIKDLRLDPNYCGLMADSVTKVDTSAISKQVNALIDQLKEEIDSLSIDALNILLRSGPLVLSKNQFGTELPANPVNGQFFVLIEE